KKKLMTAIAMVVGSLDRLDTILEAVRELGRRHGEYGVSAEDYETVGAALLWTLEQGLGELWSADLAEAWTAAYGALSTVMIAAADEDRAAA
ncbi:MAG: globin domain-containing protein, partial [Caulobacterales bacterium]|nr:globin domain-containing protein [Caulobacterales bacterium]